MRRWAAAMVALGLLSGCAVFRHAPEPGLRAVPGASATGVASWYGPGFHGRRTANGEIFDQRELTAAHRTLPHGTRVMVTNLANGRAVEVRINDRGPFVDGRIIDLSYAAARAIDMIGPGTARVRIDVLGEGPVRLASAAVAPRPLVPPPVRDQPTSTWMVEVASMTDPALAEHLRGRLASRFRDAHVSPVATATSRWWRVRLGPYPLRSAAAAAAERVSRLGYPAILVEEPAA
jgi:peptidoglycan lytic transglycosylase